MNVPYTYENYRDTLVAYMQVKIQQSDWHAVADVANDLRVLEAQEEARQARSTPR